MTEPSPFADALAALDSGDVEALEILLDQDPELVHSRVETREPPYDGYFARATLLHHVAGNPVRTPLPDRTVEIASLLLARGADPEATCGGGPSQPESTGGTTLGLVASGAQAHRRGFTKDLLDTLLEAGATMDAPGTGGTMWTALYHTVEHRGQREVAGMLYERGHPLDLCYAAGLGMDAEVRSRLDQGPGTADHYYRHHRRGGAADRPELLQDALLFAAVNGRETTVRILLEAGAEVNALRPWGPQTVTPLHGAAWAGWPELVPALLTAGADASLRDPRYDSTPMDWAHHCKRRETVAAFFGLGIERT